MLYFLIFLILFDVAILFLLIPLISKKNAKSLRMTNLERKIELLIMELEKKLKELEVTKEQIIYERDKAIKEIKALSFEVEKKIKMAHELIRKNESERKGRVELVKQLLRKGKKEEEIATELQIPLSEVKFIKELMEKQHEVIEKTEDV